VKDGFQFLVAEPQGSQARVIATYIKKYLPDCDVIGLVDGDCAVRRQIKPYKKLVSSQEPISLEACIVPTGARSTAQMLRRHDVSIGRVTLRQAALDVYQKPWMIEMAASVGVPVPTTHLSIDGDITFPLFYKQKNEEGGSVRGIARRLSQVPKKGREQLIYQEYIASPGTYGVGFIADRGEIVTSFAHFERESFPETGGSAVILERHDDDRLTAYTKRILDRIGYSGWGLAEFKYCPVRDDYVFMEINAKFWASCEFSFINQPDFLKLLFGIEVKEPNVERMVFVDRTLMRGPIFIFKNFGILRRADSYRLYTSALRCLAVGLLPADIRRLLMHLVAGISRKSDASTVA
jgi:hypothetical protein